MSEIKLTYNEDLVEDTKYFLDFMNSIKELFGEQLLCNLSTTVDFEVNLNNKIIYTLDDNFDCDGKITNSVLDKSLKTIQNSILLNKSKDVSRVDDIGIDDY